MTNLVYRARGIYIPTGKDSYLTTVWRRSQAEVDEDMRVFGQNFRNLHIAQMDYVEHANKHSHQKNPYPRGVR